MIVSSKTATTMYAAIVCAAIMLFASTAAAQGLLDALLNPFRRPTELPATVQAPPLDLSARPFAKTSIVGVGRFVITSGVNGPWTAYCVRLCDGRYFPLHRSVAMSPAEQCQALCPAANTKVLGGSTIASASAADGTRYVNLENAYLYRKRVVENCTCNGRDAFGVARIDPASDPTLRAGDIVAANGGFAVVTGARPPRRGAEFTPIEKSSGIAGETRRRLVQTKVMPAPPMPPAQSANADSKVQELLLRRDQRRAQLFR